MDDYQILTVSNALLNSPSISLSLSFEELGRQFINPTTYNKYHKSEYDIYFKEEILDEAKQYKKAKKLLLEAMEEYQKDTSVDLMPAEAE